MATVGLLTVLLAVLCSAQDTAALTGTVRDKTGALVPNAKVELRSKVNGLTRELVTNSEGSYLGAALPPGQYDVIVSARGFKKYEAHDVTLRVAQNARIDVVLQVGNAESVVNVQGEGLARVNTDRKSTRLNSSHANISYAVF